VSDSKLLNKQEQEIMGLLTEAWKRFVSMSTLHTDEPNEFKNAIHQAQLVIMARPVQREFNQSMEKMEQFRYPNSDKA
jgi:hypothetical protein